MTFVSYDPLPNILAVLLVIVAVGGRGGIYVLTSAVGRRGVLWYVLKLLWESEELDVVCPHCCCGEGGGCCCYNMSVGERAI